MLEERLLLNHSYYPFRDVDAAANSAAGWEFLLDDDFAECGDVDEFSLDDLLPVDRYRLELSPHTNLYQCILEPALVDFFDFSKNQSDFPVYYPFGPVDTTPVLLNEGKTLYADAQTHGFLRVALSRKGLLGNFPYLVAVRAADVWYAAESSVISGDEKYAFLTSGEPEGVSDPGELALPLSSELLKTVEMRIVRP